MKISWAVLGLCAYAILLFSPVATLLRIPPALNIFESDAAQYSAGAKHLIAEGFYSLDGVHPYFEREPGQSVLLVGAYLLFGQENPIGVYVIHSLLLLCASLFFCAEIARRTTPRAAGITFLLLLTSGSTLQATLSANRELLALVLLMTLATIYLKKTTFSLGYSILMGILLGALVLTYYPFFFLFIPFGILWLVDRRPRSLLAVCVVTCLAIVAVWCTRNALQTGQFTLVEGRRAAITLYSRGEQAERLRGLEPLRCLWSEYISRDWTGRSDACSIVGLWHRKWPEGMESATDLPLIRREAQKKILAHPIAHLWNSVFDAIELHFPFVGGGWSNAFNRYAMMLHIILYAGVLLGARFFLRRDWRILIVLMSYTVVIFSLIDGIPRYLTPVIFCYCAFAGMGFDSLLRFLSSKFPARAPCRDK